MNEHPPAAINECIHWQRSFWAHRLHVFWRIHTYINKHILTHIPLSCCHSLYWCPNISCLNSGNLLGRHPSAFLWSWSPFPARAHDVPSLLEVFCPISFNNHFCKKLHFFSLGQKEDLGHHSALRCWLPLWRPSQWEIYLLSSVGYSKQHGSSNTVSTTCDEIIKKREWNWLYQLSLTPAC